MIRLAACAAALALALGATPARAQNLPTGYVSLFGDYFPESNDTTELRGRLFVEEKIEPSPGVRVALSGFAEIWPAATRPES